ncbi:MAG: MBG domain-containing protein, partial [Paludibacter sp.]
VTYSYVGVNGTTYSASATQPTAAGSYTVTASVATDVNYNAASSSATAFSIDKATPTITVTPVETYTYNGSDQGPNAVTKGGSTGAVTYSYVGVNGTTYSASATRPTAAGSYTVTASVATDANYNAASSSATAFSIDKATQTITFNSLPTGKIVGNADFTPGATSATSGTNAITYSSSNTAVATIVSGNIHIIGVGNTTIYADQAFSDNYNAATQVSQSLTVDGQSSISIVVPKTATEILTNPTADVALSSTLTMDEDKTVKNITVSAAGTINLPTSKVLTVNGNLDLKADLTSSFSVNLGSSSISLPTGVVRYLKTIDDTKWYFISFPCNVNIASIKESNGTSLGTLGINWFIKYYNGQRRADNGSDGSNWISITAADLGTTPNLLANKGYIIGLSTNTGVSKEIAFPLDKAILSGEAAKTSIPVSIYNGSATAPNHGWNLVGQPYISKFDVAGAGVPYIYFVKTGGSGYDYYLPTDGTRIENPFGAYFVQSSGNTSVSFDTSSRQSVRSSVATNVSDNLQLNFSSVSGTDRTNIIMDNTMSSAYVIGQDLEKWFGSSAAVYTLLGGINYALNGLPMTSVVNLPLGVYSLNGGAATISASANNAPSLSKLILTDNVLHTTTNLLEKYYPYTATAGTDNTRFQITAQRVVTDVNLTSNELGETQFMITPIAIGAKLMINNLNTNAIVRVYDALGRMLVSKNVTSNVMEIKLNARGIYTVQMQNGATISSRKVIF